MTVGMNEQRTINNINSPTATDNNYQQHSSSYGYYKQQESNGFSEILPIELDRREILIIECINEKILSETI